LAGREGLSESAPARTKAPGGGISKSVPGPAAGARAELRSVGYDEGRERLAPSGSAAQTKVRILREVLLRGVAHNDAVSDLVLARSRELRASGGDWSGYRAIVRHLHDHADSLILSQKPSGSFLNVAVYAKSVACLFAFVANRLDPELERIRDDVAVDQDAVMKQALHLVDVVFEQYWRQTVDWFFEVADDRPRWKQMPPFLR